MTKEECILYLLKKIYESKEKCFLTKKEIKYVEGYYKKNYLNFDIFSTFVQSDLKFEEILTKVKNTAIYNIIEKQFNDKEALQPGMLTESVIVKTLAKLLNLRSFRDLSSCGFDSIPIVCASVVRSKAETLSAARYIYFNSQDEDIFIFQYGNPKCNDASIVIKLHEIVIEIKDMPALLGDKDLIYDENGKIIITENIREIPIYTEIIEDFNSKTNIIEQVGSNYPLFPIGEDIEKRNSFFNDFFKLSETDIFITMKKDELIAIKKEDINYIFDNGDPLISTKGSEIRTTGKNHLPVFTHSYLETVLNEYDVNVIDDICYISKNNNKVQGYKKARGKEIISRFGLNNSFYVEVENVNENENFYMFLLKDIQQNKSGISIHIDIKKSKKFIKQNLYNYL